MHYRIVSIPASLQQTPLGFPYIVMTKYAPTLADAPWGGSIASGLTSIVDKTAQLSVT